MPRRPSRLIVPLQPRDPGEAHRAATPLELLYDLCFVVAIAQAASSLHHGISGGHGLEYGLWFIPAFFAIWWAWMGFAWFASAFDNDDALYRVTVLIQMVGVLVLAAGIPRVFEHHDFGLVTAGYVVMRVGLIAQWVRAAVGSPTHRRAAVRYVIGITVCQLGWVGLLLGPTDAWIYGWFILVTLEMAVPVWAETCTPTPWHPEHIAERYGLMTIIVIGESVLATTLAIQSALDAGDPSRDLISVIAGAPLVFFSMWWLYFACPSGTRLASIRQAFTWAYAHSFVFAAAAAVGAGLAVAVDEATGRTALSAFWSGQALAMPAAAYLAALWVAQVRGAPGTARITAAFAICIAGILLAPFVLPSPLSTGGLLATLTAYLVASRSAG